MPNGYTVTQLKNLLEQAEKAGAGDYEVIFIDRDQFIEVNKLQTSTRYKQLGLSNKS